MLAEAVVWPTMDNFCSCNLSPAHVDSDAAGLWLDGPEGNTCYDDPGDSFSADGAHEVLEDGESGLPAQRSAGYVQAAVDLLGDCHGRDGLCTDVSGWVDDASKRGLLLFTQLHDEPGVATNWCGVWEPLPEASYGRARGKIFGGSGGAIQNHRCLECDIRPTLVCDRDLVCEQVQTAVVNIDYFVQLVPALNVDVSGFPPLLRWRELMSEDLGYYNDPFSKTMCIVQLRLQEQAKGRRFH